MGAVNSGTSKCEGYRNNAIVMVEKGSLRQAALRVNPYMRT